jgi:hypothetical protein
MNGEKMNFKAFILVATKEGCYYDQDPDDDEQPHTSFVYFDLSSGHYAMSNDINSNCGWINDRDVEDALEGYTRMANVGSHEDLMRRRKNCIEE